MISFEEIYEELSQLQERIVKKGSKWQVQSEKGKNMGTYDTKEEAEKRLKQIEYFKHLNESSVYASYEPINLEAFEDDINNVLYIIGASGSGKSTLADMLADKYNAKVINLDNGWLGGIAATTEEALEISWFDKEFWNKYPKYKVIFDKVCNYIDLHPESANSARDAIKNIDSNNDYANDYIEYALEYTKNHSHEKFIIEGVQLLDKNDAGYLYRAAMGPSPSIIIMRTKSKRVTRNIINRAKERGEEAPNRKDIHKQNMIWKKKIADFEANI